MFVLPKKSDKPAFPKMFTLGTVFENLRFRSIKTPFTRGRKTKTAEKISVFKNILIRVGEKTFQVVVLQSHGLFIRGAPARLAGDEIWYAGQSVFSYKHNASL